VSPIKRPLAAAIELHDALLAAHQLLPLQDRLSSPLRVDGLDESDKVRVDVQVSRHGTLACLGRGSVRRFEEGRLIQSLCSLERC